MVEIFLLSLIQGITEFLPVSSSSHLIIFSKYTSFENQSLSIDISLHIGSFLAVISYFHKDIINFIKNKFLKNKRLVDKRFVKHLEYEKELGATYYVSKFIKSDNIKYGISYSDNYKL